MNKDITNVIKEVAMKAKECFAQSDGVTVQYREGDIGQPRRCR